MGRGRGPGGHGGGPGRPGHGLGHRRAGACGGHARRAVGRAGPRPGLGAGVRQRRRARPAGALPAHRRARRRHHHLPGPGVAAAGPADPGAVADPRGVDRLRRRAQRRPGHRGGGGAGRPARRPSPRSATGLRLRRADGHDRARLRAPLPRPPSRAGRGRHHLGPCLRPASSPLPARSGRAGDDVVPRGRCRRRRDAVAPGRRRRAGRPGGDRGAVAPIARRPEGSDPARAPARSGRGPSRSLACDRTVSVGRRRAALPGR